MFFGYMNPNWEEEFDVPVGADNALEPGGPDQGQPTHFYPAAESVSVHDPRAEGFGTRELDLDARRRTAGPRVRTPR